MRVNRKRQNYSSCAISCKKLPFQSFGHQFTTQFSYPGAFGAVARQKGSVQHMEGRIFQKQPLEFSHPAYSCLFSRSSNICSQLHNQVEDSLSPIWIRHKGICQKQVKLDFGLSITPLVIALFSPTVILPLCWNFYSKIALLNLELKHAIFWDLCHWNGFISVESRPVQGSSSYWIACSTYRLWVPPVANGWLCLERSRFLTLLLSCRGGENGEERKEG